MQAIAPLFALILLLGPVFVGPARAADLILKKGPILHVVQDKQIVRIQGPALKEPAVEWREKDGDSKKESMKAVGYDFWQAPLSDQATEYRIVAGESSSPWQTVLNGGGQSKDKFTFIAYGDNRSGWGNPRVHESLLG